MTSTAQTSARLQLFGAALWSTPRGRQDLPDNLPGYLLVYLAYGGEWFGRATLAGLLWSERADAEAQHNLRANLHRVRALLAAAGCPDVLQAERQRIRVQMPSDVAEFRAALRRSEWASAAALYAEPVFGALAFRGCPALEAWVRDEREALAQAWRDAALRAALAHERQGQAAEAAALLLRVAHSELPSEDALQALLRVAPSAGRRAEALAAYERFRRWLREDLGLQPMMATVALADALRSKGRPATTVPAPSAATASVPRGVGQPPLLVGRQVEAEQLADTSVRLLALGGEPGVGKTRLLEEALPRARFIACREGLQQVPLAAVVEYLQDFRDSLPELGPYRIDLARLLPALAPGEVLPPADPTTGKARLLEALALVLEDGSRTLAVDDAQWIDAVTAELLVLLVQRGRVPMRIAYRSTEISNTLARLLAAIDSAGARRIALEPLPEAAVTELLATLAGTQPVPPRFTAWLHARTGGNPFFVLQTLRALFESGRLRADGELWQGDLDAIALAQSKTDIPARITELVQRRLDALSETARRVLAAVALVGSGQDVDRLATAVGLSPWATAEALVAAERAGLLARGRFVHDIVRECVVAGLPAPLYVTLQASIARHFAGALAPARLAEHWWEAGRIEPALAASEEAITAASVRGLHAAGLELLQQAEQRLQSLGATEPHWHARLQVWRARLHLQRAEFEAASTCAHRVLAEAALPPDRGAAWRTLADIALQRGQLQQALHALQEARLADPQAKELLLLEVRLAYLRGASAEVIPLLEARLRQLRARAPTVALIEVLSSLGAAYDEQGEVAKGIPLHQEAYQLAKRLNARYAQVEVATNLAWALSGLGRDEEAVAVAREALALGDYDGTPTLRNNLAYSLRRLGRLQEARIENERLERGVDPTLALLARARLVALYAALDDPQACARMAERAVATLASTEVALAHYAVATNLALHGTDDQLRVALAHIHPAALDPWTRADFIGALTRRGIDPSPYLAPPDDALHTSPPPDPAQTQDA
ncbi:MAG: AAA family ATPase [Burkholderiaceae bacterium]|nr:AAA family ATPase [Burkholderiaceae bacterium]